MITSFNFGQSGFHAKTLAFLSVLAGTNGKVGTYRAMKLDRLVRDMHGETNADYTTFDLWNTGKAKAVYPFIGGTDDSHKFNLIDPRDLDAAFRLTFVGSPAHTTEGMDGVSSPLSYANTHIDMSVVLQQDSQHYAVYSQTDNTINTGAIGGGYTLLGNSGMYLYGATKKMYGYINSLDGSTEKIFASKKGFFLVKRGSATHLEYIIEGAAHSIARNTAPIVSTDVLIGRFANGNNGFVCSFASVGLHLTDAEAVFLSNAVTAYNAPLRP